MSETPKSEIMQTRFSTPVSELDDHRGHPESLPQPQSPVMHGTRRGTAASAPPPNLQLPDLQGVNDSLWRQGMTSRDFEENAIAEDDEYAISPYTRRPSNASPIVRRNTFVRPHGDIEERVSKTRSRGGSNSTSRSSSPPNSVDAFAIDPPRRPRAGTVTSKAASEHDLALHRTVSGGTHRRRPTFSEEQPEVVNAKDEEFESESEHGSVQEDVCFPVPEVAGRTFEIDFEDLEEFIAEHQEKTPIIPTNLTRRPSVASLASRQPRIFQDLRPKSMNQKPENGIDSLMTGPFPNEKEAQDGLAPTQTEQAPAEPERPPKNRFTFFSTEFDDSIHAPELSNLLMPGESFRDLFQLPEHGGVWWLDMNCPTEEEVKVICKAFRVHQLTREDILTQEMREKVELFNGYYFVCFRSFYQIDKDDEDFLEPVNVYAISFRGHGLLTFTFCANPHATNVRKRIGKLRDYIAMSSDWICYALIDDIVDSFGPVIREVEQETDAIEDQVFTARIEDSRNILRAIGECRKRVMTLLRLLGGKADVIKGFSKRCNEKFEVTPRGDVGLYLSDIQDHVVTMMSNLAHFEKMLSRSHSNYLAQISVDSLTQGNTINEMLGKVTVIATVIVPLNIITGLFGMNVTIPGQDSGHLYWFFGILGVILTFIAVSLLLAKRMRLW